MVTPVTMVGFPKSMDIQGFASDKMVDIQLPFQRFWSLFPSTANELVSDIPALERNAVELCDVRRPRAMFTLRLAEQHKDCTSYSNFVQFTWTLGDSIVIIIIKTSKRTVTINTLKHLVVYDMRCNKKKLFLASRSSSPKYGEQDGCEMIDPSFSKTNGRKVWVLASDWYLSSFQSPGSEWLRSPQLLQWLMTYMSQLRRMLQLSRFASASKLRKLLYESFMKIKLFLSQNQWLNKNTIHLKSTHCKIAKTTLFSLTYL